jgi:uncharacterized protein HemX
MEPAKPSEPHLQPQPTPSAPVMDVVAPKPQEAPKDLPKVTEESVELKPQKSVNSKPVQTTGRGVGLAIFATIVIVLGLAALMVYAYLRTKHTRLF